jgi:hypothetical protein
MPVPCFYVYVDSAYLEPLDKQLSSSCLSEHYII